MLVFPVSFVVVYTLLKEWKWIREVWLVSVSACILVARACKRCLTGRLVRLRVGLASNQRHPACTVIRVLEMESIRVIQEVVDAHKEQMPTGVVTTVMEECQKVYDAQSKMYKLTWTVVDSHAHIEHIEDEEDIANR